MASNEVGVQVAVRCRPLIGLGEKLGGAAEFIQCLKEQKQVIVDKKVFSFDYVFDSTDEQRTIYDISVAPIVQRFLSGNNASVIAYGQTGSGKTYTMGTVVEPPKYDADATIVEIASDLGIIPHVLQNIFDGIDDTGESVITVSFLEVYNEEVYDILTPSRPPIPIREEDHIIKLPKLKEVTVTSYEDAIKCLADGARIRTTGVTARNAHSSRSHAIFSVHLDQKLNGKRIESRMMLVDLAGSENVKKTKTQGSRFQEGININRGLLALGNVVRALSKNCDHIPFRDSTLSRLLQICLQRNSNTLIIACINQVENNFLETTSTLQFAINARAVKIKFLPGGDRETPCGWKRPYSSLITPNTQGRSRLNCMLGKGPLNSTMMVAAETRGFAHSASGTPVEPIPLPLNFSPTLPVLQESPVEPVFKKPRTPPQITPTKQKTTSFTPYVERICSSFEKCVGKLLANRPSPRFDTPMRLSLVDSIARQTAHALQERTSMECRSIFGSRENTVIGASPSFESTKDDQPDSFLELTDVKRSATNRRTGENRQIIRRSMRHQAMNDDTTTRNRGTLQQSILMSPNRTVEDHTAGIVRILNEASERQLQRLPKVGPKTAVIIFNWRLQNGPFKDVSELKKVPGLPASFLKRFVQANSLVQYEELF